MLDCALRAIDLLLPFDEVVAGLVAVLLAAWLWLAWVVTRRARDEPPDREAPGRPERDPVAGVAGNAPDQVLLKVV